MLRRSRYRRSRVLLPGEREGRRSFLKWGLAGTAILALGGGTWLATRRTRPIPSLAGPFQALSPEEVAVVVALAERLVPSRSGWPRPLELDLPRRVDGIVALLPGPERKEIGQLVRLFENALAGFALDGQFRTFTDSTPEQQDARIRAWQTSRYRLRRSGFRALKKIVYGAYYGAPAAWPAIGYPGPPRVSAPATAEAPEAEATSDQAPPRPPPRAVRSTPPAPRAVEDVPAPRSGMDLPQERKP